MESVYLIGVALFMLATVSLAIWLLRRPYDRSASLAATERLLAEQRADAAALDSEIRHDDPKDSL